MEWPTEEITRLARQIQCDIEQWRHEKTGSGESIELTDTAGKLERIEGRLEDLHAETSELIRRVPCDLGDALSELKRALLVRLAESAQATQSDDRGTAGPQNRGNHSSQSPATIVRSLTRQERHVFQLCFESGFMTYREIAEELDITPSAAKSLVNRMFQSDRKRPLFAKQYKHGSVRVGIRPNLEKVILAGAGKNAPGPERVVAQDQS